MNKRKVIQIAMPKDAQTIVVLCDDGTIWQRTFPDAHEQDWKPIPAPVDDEA